MQTEIFVIRHGESEANRRDAFLGHMDLPLTDIGRKQAAAAAAYLKDIKPDVIYSSDLSRAYETVRPLAEALGMDVIRRRDLREVDVGVWQGMLIEDVKSGFTEKYDAYKENPGIFAFEIGRAHV